ncbi:MAG: hypothetical protein LBD14_01645 [Puniceicoccales bacterium]|jgi:4-diphosphocytidyl-2-C-methyl-D-erythritol kinase|nr:hypothetical protein [Puniceicoccales bacterium]
MPAQPLRVAHAPAKVNLLLAITAVRPDGYHELISLVAPVAHGDTLWLALDPGAPPGAADTLQCDTPGVPTDASNLVLKATAAYRASYPRLPRAHYILQKRIPHGAGLGGGSSDAVAALRLLNEVTGQRLSFGELVTLSARLGSDCPLFLHNAPLVMRGRGERIETLPENAITALRGRRLLLFKPAFGVVTVDAYNAMRATPGGAAYIPAAVIENRLDAWLTAPATAPLPLYNNMENPVFEKHPALPLLLGRLETEHSLRPRMSGSGSACYAFLPETASLPAITATIRETWGDSAFICETTLA